ncbi:uncharacterized protein LOC123523921 isoform X3 [Mercenaria mercenaria]|uniref:uncharacterized protein LOC123523921 isoform X3 n=1 Tax=Mercenaria mercenaria TaxID=6596 RepID=UPI00234E6E18|nr:uncharacterized protein LOC123523921 isoform X3 [Mercenaria mercenaria]XP_053395391.1 uncharacterized protein LOC123523921 isoform X3 [Mercenaria mercenaria]
MAENLTSNEYSSEEDAEFRVVGQSEFLRLVSDVQTPLNEDVSYMEREGEGGVLSEIFKKQAVHDLDPYAADLFMEALQDGMEKDSAIRVNIVGNFGQGKTSLVCRLIGKSLHDVSRTNGIDVVRYECQQTNDGKFTYTERGRIEPSEFAKRIVMAELHKDKSRAKEKSKHSSSLFETGKDRSKFKFFRDSRSILNSMTKREVRSLNETVKHLRFQPASKDSSPNASVHFDIWDFGGQHVFYATHTLFHSSKAIYVLVFDLSVPFNEVVHDQQEDCCVITEKHPMIYYLRFWVNSIHSFVGNEDGFKPPIILVGTHKDKLHGDEEEKCKQSERIFDEVRRLFRGKQCLNHIIAEDFAVDNTDMETDPFVDLRRTILHTGLKNMSDTVPTKWIQLEKCLDNMRYEGIVTLETIENINQKIAIPLENLEQIKMFLKYHHDKGTLFYFDEHPISEYIVVNPQYLIDAFKCIITAPRFRRNDASLQTYWQNLEEKAKLERPLVDTLWQHNYMKHKEVLLAFLNKHRIISEALRYDEETGAAVGIGWYIVPSLLRDHITATEIGKFLDGKNQTQIRYILTFDNSSIVPTVYHRLIAACLGKWPLASFQNKNLLYENLAVLRLDKTHAGLVEMNDTMIELSVIVLTRRQINGETVDTFRRFVDSVVQYEFRKHRNNTWVQPKPYKPSYRCNHASHILHRSEAAKDMSDLDGEFEVPCPDLESHSINVESAKSEWFQGNVIFNIPNVQPSLEQLSKLSCCIGKNWEFLAPSLQLTSVDIDHIVANYPNRTEMQIYSMLQKWQSKHHEAATMRELIQTLQKHPEVHVTWDEVRNIVKDMNA